MKKGKIYLIPCPISQDNLASIPPETIQIIHNTNYFVVEVARTARRFIKSTQHPIPISALHFWELSDDKAGLHSFLDEVTRENNIGIISEAGCPGIADPGAEVVAWAHQHNIMVVPCIGPSSILLALMASGFNGQSFTFHGYLSNKKPELIRQLKNLEQLVNKTGMTHIFMETPYRNMFILESCLQILAPNTLFCIACDLNNPQEWIKTQPIRAWKNEKNLFFHKRPCIFLIGTF